MAISLCVPPHKGELCASIRFELRSTHTVLELTARHRITKVESGSEDGGAVVWIDIVDPETSRPVDVRFSLLPEGSEIPPRTHLLGEIQLGNGQIGVYGTYLGVVSDEN